MIRGKDRSSLRTGFTTGACATAAAAAACEGLLTANPPTRVQICLPNGQTPEFTVEESRLSDNQCQASVRKDAGDDPDVTHNALIVASVRRLKKGGGTVLKAGRGVGTVTRPGLPVAVGQPAINPVPRQMICEAITKIAAKHYYSVDFEVTISVPGGEELAKQTWNPRLGIKGGISILGTTGIVKPYSCAAWISSIHRGIDVARAAQASHAAASTGSQSEATIQNYYGLPDYAMLDMGDFAGGMLKYLRRHPIPFVTIAGGFGKLTKLAQGALDLHSSRSQIDFTQLGLMAESACGSTSIGHQVANAGTAMEALEFGGLRLAYAVSTQAATVATAVVADAGVNIEVIIFDRANRMVARTSRVRFPEPFEQS